MAGSTAATAELLPFGTTDTWTQSDGDDEMWYRLEPTTTGSYKFVAEALGSDFAYLDVYRLTGSDPPAEPPWGDLADWVGWVGDYPQATQESWIELLAGEVYLVACYTFVGGSGGDNFSIRVDYVGGPSNDKVVNATVVSEGLTTVGGTTLEATEEFDEFDNWDGSQAGSVWYKLPIGGPGDAWWQIESTTPGWFPSIEVFYATGSVTGFNDLTKDSGTNQDVGDGTLTPPLGRYDQVGTPPTSTGDLAPLDNGDVLYLRVCAYNNNDASSKGSFTLTVFVPPTVTCLDAQDYLGSSSTASIVSGSVREAQVINYAWGTTPVAPWEGWMGDQEVTLSIPGEDIASSPGFYSVTIKTKNAAVPYVWNVGLKRNGQPLWPGSEMDGTTGSTSVQDFVTMPAGSFHPNTLDMVRYLPVKPGDTIDVVLARNGGSGTIDIEQICFQRVFNATEGPAYDLLDIPDYPLGTTSGDMLTNAQQGDLIVGKDTAPTFTGHRVICYDMCVTDDGTLWVAHLQQNGNFGATLTGPVLHYWDGAAWQLVNDDIEGLGTKRSTTNNGPWTLSIDTDGEDIWIVYHVDDGANPIGGGRKIKIKVRKYDVSAASWSTIGGTFHGTNSDVGSTAQASTYTRSECGQFGDTPTIRVSPNGVPWVGFVDWEAGASDPDHTSYYAQMPYVARWTGSTWDVQRLPQRSEFTEPTLTVLQAKDYRVASGTTSEVTYLGQTCVQETQTAYTNDTVSFTPAAGKWMFSAVVAKDYISGAACGLKWKLYKNGTALTPFTDDFNSGDTVNDFIFNIGGWGAVPEVYTECNGSDVISIRMAKTGSGTEDIYMDEILIYPVETWIQQDGFGINVNFVDDGQPHVGLFMHRVGETGLGENPGALYQTSFTVPQIDDPGAPDYWAPDTAGNQCWNWQTWVYSEWDGSQWVRKWQKLIEDDAPYHVYLRTYADGVASTPPVGHFQQGFGFCTDGIDNYMTANCGGGQAFGFFPDQIVALKIGETGFVPFTDGPPGGVASYGYPLWDDGDGGFGQTSWTWDTNGRSINVDTNGNVWVGFSSVGGAPGEFTDIITVAAKNGIGDWFIGALNNEEFGYDIIYSPAPSIISSPDGTKVYILWDVAIYDNGTPPNEPWTFGVWECDVIPDAKIPLVVTIGGKAVRIYPDGRYEVLDRAPQKVLVLPSGEVKIQSGETNQRVLVKKDGTVNIL